MSKQNFPQHEDDDTLKGLHDTDNSKNIVHKEGQSKVLCSNNKLCDCPSLRYEYVEDKESLEKAYDILFEAMFKNLIKKRHAKKNNSDLRKGIHNKTRGRADRKKPA